MRTVEEMLQELGREAPRFSMVAIVVAFDDTSSFIFHDDDTDKMRRDLETMIDAGGEPFGLLGYIATEKDANVASFVYDEFRDTAWANPLMEELSQNMAATLRGYQQRMGSA